MAVPVPLAGVFMQDANRDTAAYGDFNGDGITDLLVAGGYNGLVVFHGRVIPDDPAIAVPGAPGTPGATGNSWGTHVTVSFAAASQAVLESDFARPRAARSRIPTTGRATGIRCTASAGSRTRHQRRKDAVPIRRQHRDRPGRPDQQTGHAAAIFIRIVKEIKEIRTARNLLDRLPWEKVPLGLRIALNRGARFADAARAAYRTST